MSKGSKKAVAEELKVDEQHIREYLKANPDFFDQHPDILDHLTDQSQHRQCCFAG